MPPTTDHDSPRARGFARPPRPTPAALALLLLAACATTDGAPPTDERLAFLLTKYDRDGDGRVARSEHDRAPTGFARLDRDGDGFVGAADFALPPPPPPPGLGGPFLFVRAFGARGADAVSAEEALVGFDAVDADGDGRATPVELAAAVGPEGAGVLLQAVDADRDGALVDAEIGAYVVARDRDGDAKISRRERDRPGREPPVGRFPPSAREPAPDFALRRLDGAGTVRLADLRGRPVALIFGSFT